MGGMPGELAPLPTVVVVVVLGVRGLNLPKPSNPLNHCVLRGLPLPPLPPQPKKADQNYWGDALGVQQFATTPKHEHTCVIWLINHDVNYHDAS